MAERIEIGLKSGVPDARGRGVVGKARSFLGLGLSSCRTRDVFRIDIELKGREVAAIRKAFADPVIGRSAIGRLSPPPFEWLIEVGFKPGVTDNVGRTAEVVVADVLGRKLGPYEQVYTSTQYFLKGGGLSRDDATRIATDLLANVLIQTVAVYSPEEWSASPIDESVPAIHDDTEARVRTYDLSGSDDDLMRISREGILSLSLDEMHAIREHYKRPDVRAERQALGLPAQPTDLELECIAQTWSEHCSHKIFAGNIRYMDENGDEENIQSLFKTYIRAATEKIGENIDWLVSVFTDNAGIIAFNERIHLAYKVETHNSPSALDPYGGSITGIVGVNRDPMGTGMGCQLLANVWGYCLGSPFYDGDLPAGLMHPRRIRDGVHEGVIDGGNQSGIPWVRGFECFDDRYIGKPLVYCGTLGTIPVTVTGGPSERKEIVPGDLVVMCGGRIGKDGIHGATFSSEELRQESPAQAVQIGDPITQRKMYEFLMEARDLGLFRCITDNGAGGISCSFGEMGKYSGGAEVDLKNAPLKYEGLQPWEIFLSEAQERMTLAVDPAHIGQFMDLATRRDVEATVMGAFTSSGELKVMYGDRLIGLLDMDFLYETGCPTLEMEARWKPPEIQLPQLPKAGSRTKNLLSLLGRLNVCSKEFKSRSYDGEVKGLSVIKPFVGVYEDVPTDATVMRVEYQSNEGVALAEGINPFYSDIDTYDMTASVIDEAVRRIISVGGRLDRIAGLDNFCWPDPVQSEKTPDGFYKMAQLVRSNKALYDITTAYGVPCISGKDSMKNDSVRGGRKISIPPTLLFSTIGRIDDVRTVITMDWKHDGDVIYIIGVTRDEMGASEYHRMLAEDQGEPGHFGGRAPGLDVSMALTWYRAMNRATDAGLLKSAHTPTVGGLGVALALCALGGDLGADVDMSAVPLDGIMSDDAVLFSESNSRFVVTCTEEKASALEAIFEGLPIARIGTVNSSGRLTVSGKRGRRIVDADLAKLRKAFKKTLWNI
ncbi:MAG: phosphoribosylformylglycinamidine synthase [Verrucomicrobia bacterium]|nr:phosphoribosylformylglycinamidine synthase [Verrucomicrobiota bacterium]